MSDLFEISGGRYIKRSPEIAQVHSSVVVPGMRGQTWEILFHVNPEGITGRAIIAVPRQRRVMPWTSAAGRAARGAAIERRPR